jgi:hypothetical protein
MSSDNAKPRATALPRLEWQGELDSAMSEIDDRLTHPRRRATDLNRPPVLPEMGNVRVSNELLDEIAWRVAQQIRNNGEQATAANVTKALQEPRAQAPATARPAAARPPIPPAPPAGGTVSGLQPGKMIIIRYKLPALPWPLSLLQRRKKEPPLATARLRA